MCVYKYIASMYVIQINIYVLQIVIGNIYEDFQGVWVKEMNEAHLYMS